MTALSSAPPHAERAWDRWTRLVEAVGATVVGEGRAEMPCPVHGGAQRKFAISVGDESEYPLLRCRSACDSDDPSWLAKATAALLALGAPRDALPPAKGQGGRQRPSAPAAAAKKAARTPRAAVAAGLPGEQQIERWEAAFLANDLMRRALMKKWRLSDDVIAAAEVGYDQAQDRIVLPVRDEACQVVQVIYRSLRDDLPPSVPKAKTHPGVRGSFIYAPLGVDGGDVLLCAGERDAFTAHAAGLNAVCFTGGEGSVPTTDRLHLLRGRDVVIAYDNDDAGRRGAQKAAAAVAAVAHSVRVADLSTVLGLAAKGDVADVLAMPGGEQMLRDVLASAEAWEGQPVESAEVPASSWLARNLSDVLRDDYQPQRPSIGARADGVCLFYRGLKHVLVAESEAGKTWLALLAAIEQMDAGENVVFFAFEDTAHGVVGRLRALGVPTDVISRHFHYARPDEPLTEDLQEMVVAAVAALTPALVIVDGVTEAMALHGWEINSNNDVALFYKTLLTPFGDVGAAVVALDHLPKDDTKRRGSIGGVHKLNGIDGAVYRLENVHQIIPGREGLTRVVIDKDRPGEVRKHQDDKKRIAEMSVFSDEDGSVRLALEAPRSTAPTDEERAASNKALNKVGKQVQVALGVGVERTVSDVETALNKNGTPVSRSSVQRWLRVLGDMGHAASREEAVNGRPIFHWTGVQPGGKS